MRRGTTQKISGPKSIKGIYKTYIGKLQSETDLETIENVQKKVARLINATWHNTENKWSKKYEEYLQDLHWQTIEQRHFYLFNCQVYKVSNQLDCLKLFYFL